QPLLVLLLPLALDVELPLLAPDIRRALPFELVPVDHELVLDGDLVIHELPHGGERERTVLQFQILEVRRLLVRPAHRPGELVPVLRDRQGGRPLLVADLVGALPRPDRVDLVGRASQAAEREDQRRREDRLHDCLQEMAGAGPSDADGLRPLTAIVGMPRPPVRMAWPSAGSRASSMTGAKRAPNRPAVPRPPSRGQPPTRQPLVT